MKNTYNIIGDIHGMTNWKDFVKDDAVNVFLGDYFDPYTTMSFDSIKENFLSIIEFKKNRPETVLLLGNHDTHYIYEQIESTRFMYFNYKEIYRLFMDNIGMFNGVAFAPDSTHLCSHAGFSKSWLNTLSKHYNIDIPTNTDDALLLAEWANILFYESIENINYRKTFTFSRYADVHDHYGTSTCHSCIWLRPSGLLSDSISKNIVQIVGHTEVEHPLEEIVSKGNRVVFTDCLRTKNANSYLLMVN